MTWLITLVALVGVVLNIQKRRECFWVWLCTNTSWCVIDFVHGLYSQATLMAVYAVLSVYGLWSWRTNTEVRDV